MKIKLFGYRVSVNNIILISENYEEPKILSLIEFLNLKCEICKRFMALLKSPFLIDISYSEINFP